eukprot:6381756-Amphidinium_carterae.2
MAQNTNASSPPLALLPSIAWPAPCPAATRLESTELKPATRSIVTVEARFHQPQCFCSKL